MSIEFTKPEAAELLGEVLQVIKKYSSKDSHPDIDVSPGEVGKIFGIDFYDNEVKLNVDISGNFYLVTKPDFEECFLLLKPEIIQHDNLS